MEMLRAPLVSGPGKIKEQECGADCLVRAKREGKVNTTRYLVAIVTNVARFKRTANVISQVMLSHNLENIATPCLFVERSC